MTPAKPAGYRAPVIEVRLAGPDDAPELVRLREVMLTGVTGAAPESNGWQSNAEISLRQRLSDGTMVAFVVDQPGGRRLAACVVGVIEHRLGSPSNPTGEVGYVFNVATDPGYRRRGYSRACMRALLAWYRKRGVRRVDLRASSQGEPLYRALGFVRTRDPAMRLSFPSD
jgi:GNAT superfamily N-acetyltransferase